MRRGGPQQQIYRSAPASHANRRPSQTSPGHPLWPPPSEEAVQTTWSTRFGYKPKSTHCITSSNEDFGHPGMFDSLDLDRTSFRILEICTGCWSQHRLPTASILWWLGVSVMVSGRPSPTQPDYSGATTCHLDLSTGAPKTRSGKPNLQTGCLF